MVSLGVDKLGGGGRVDHVDTMDQYCDPVNAKQNVIQGPRNKYVITRISS